MFSGDAGPASQHAEELTALDTAPPEGMYWAQGQGFRELRPIEDLERSVDLSGYRPRALSGRPARSTLEQQRASLSDPDSQWLSHVLSQSARVAFATPVGDTMLEEAGMAADSMRADGFPRGGLDAGGLSLKETGMAAFLAEANAALDRMPSFNSTTSSEEEAVEAGVKMEGPSVARLFSGASETASVSTARPSEVIEERTGTTMMASSHAAAAALVRGMPCHSTAYSHSLTAHAASAQSTPPALPPVGCAVY